MLDTDPVSLHFRIPATDHLGRENVQGQLHFDAEKIALHWRLEGNVFTGGSGEMTLVEIPYPSVAEVQLKKRWFRPTLLTLRLDDPGLTAEIPGVGVGLLTLELDSASKVEVDRLNDFIDFRRSIFLLDETDKRLSAMRGQGSE